MQLVADRFAVNARGQAFDLATGVRVCLVSSTAGGATEQAQWAERCAWFAALVHPSVARLLDYGACGEHARFEAWAAQPGWPGAASAAQQCALAAQRFLRACGRSCASQESITVGTVGGRPVAVPDGASGLGVPFAMSEPSMAVDRETLGVIRTADTRVAMLADAFTAPAPTRLVAVGVWAPEGGGVGHAIHQLSRAARLAGLVPVCVSLFDSAVRELLRGRSLLLIAHDDVERGWRAIVDAALDQARPHLVLFAGQQPVPRVHTIPLDRRPLEGLVASVCPEAAVRAQARHVATAARRSAGLPDRFEQLLLGRAVPASGQQARSPLRAAESAGFVDADAASLAGATPRDRSKNWPAPGELVRLRRQLQGALLLLARGRHAPGERAARHAIHALARRGDWERAADGAVHLSQALARRGRLSDAEQLIDAARPWVTQSCDLALTLRLALVRAAVWTEAGRLTDAESLLETVVSAALSAESPLRLDATLAMARCLFWQGRYPDAWQRLLLLRADAGAGETAEVRIAIARSRVAIGQVRPAEAVALAARARDVAVRLGDPALCGAARYACALAQLAAGDAAQAETTTALAVADARRARDPLLAAALRLLHAACALRQGRRGPAIATLSRFGRLPSARLPLTIRARVDLLRDQLAGHDPLEAAERRADATGLQALRLWVSSHTPAAPETSSCADDIVEVMRCCQAAEEDGAVLAAVCGLLRVRLRASAVAFFVFDRGEPASVAGNGAGIGPASARRVHAASQLVLPHQGAERIEGGVPVRYAGSVVGVLVATWMPGVAWQTSEVSVLLSTGATAAGPALSGVLARRASERGSRASELLGVSTVVAGLRAAIDKAASAPFAVLVEGESGSGKELVARLLHKLGPRAERPFCTLNCAALPDELIESELFGHARGAFTGAMGDRRGVFEEAHHGTLFLDEVGELSPRAQAKLLRAIQEGEIRRVGENVCRRVDVRLVTATNRDLRAEVGAGRFRLDLLYRLDVIRIVLPPLRARRDDITVLAEHFWREATGRVNSRATLSAPTLAALARHDWPGNIRELQNVLAALAVRSPRRGVVPPSALPIELAQTIAEPGPCLEAARRTFDRTFIRAALARAGGRRTRAAEELGLSRQGLAKLMARLDLGGEAAADGS